MERYLEVEGDVRPIVSHRLGPREVGGCPRPLPEAFAAVLPLVERDARFRHVDLAEEVTERTARELWDALATRASALSRAGRLAPELGEVDRLDSWQLVHSIAATVADGMTYAWSGGQDFDPDEPRGDWARRWQGLTLLLSSAWQLRSDLRALPWLARQPLRRGLRGLCRHYSAIVTTLFFAAKRATGRHMDAWVPAIEGCHRFLSSWEHAWNWYVERDAQRIVAFDLTGADWLLDRGQADTPFNRGFDGSRWNNVSCLLARLFAGYACDGPLGGRPEVPVALKALVDPQSQRGQALLFHLTWQTGLHPGARERVRAFLRALRFHRFFGAAFLPRPIFGLRRAVVDRYESALDVHRQCALLEAIGL